MTENAGIFVCRTRHVTLAGGSKVNFGVCCAVCRGEAPMNIVDTALCVPHFNHLALDFKTGSTFNEKWSIHRFERSSVIDNKSTTE